MNPLVVSRKLCLGDRALPLFEKQMVFEDIHGVCPGDLDEQVFECLNLKANQDCRWLETSLKLPSKWWALNAGKVPLLSEIRQAIEAGRPAKRDRRPLKSEFVVGIKVRGHVLLVQNTTVAVHLCWPAYQDDGDQGQETIEWFLSEFQKDLVVMQQQQQPSSSGSSSRGCSTKRTPHEHEAEIIDVVLSALREHSRCKSAVFVPSRGVVKVIRSDKRCKSFRPKNLKNKRTKAIDRDSEEDWQVLENIFAEVVIEAKKFIEDSGPSGPSGVVDPGNKADSEDGEDASEVD